VKKIDYPVIISPLSKMGGFNLIELLVSLALASFILIGVTNVLDANRRTNNLQNSFVEVQDSARVALDMISRDVRNADFWGCLGGKSWRITDLKDKQDGVPKFGTSPIYTHVESGLISWYNDFGNGGIDGMENDTSTYDGHTVAAGNDTLILRGGNSEEKMITGGQGTETYIPLLPNGSTIEACDYVIASTCGGTEIFVNTYATGLNNVGFDGGAGGCDAINSGAKFNFTPLPNGTVLLKLYEKRYFIAEGANGDNSLFRMENGVARELVPGVERFKIEFGLDMFEDADGDGADDVGYAATSYVTPNEIPDIAGEPTLVGTPSAVSDGSTDVWDWQRVVAVRIEMTVKSASFAGNSDKSNVVDLSVGDGDGRMKKEYTIVASVRNRTHR